MKMSDSEKYFSFSETESKQVSKCYENGEKEMHTILL
jgi:hypothetical protein